MNDVAVHQSERDTDQSAGQSKPRSCGNDKIRWIKGLAYSYGPRVERRDESGQANHVEPPEPGEKAEFWGLYAWLDDRWVWRADFACETALHTYLSSLAGTTLITAVDRSERHTDAAMSVQIFVNGEANSYTLLQGDRWIANVLMNGEMLVARQMQLLGSMAVSLDQKLRSTEQ